MRRSAIWLLAGLLLLVTGPAARADDAALGRSGETVFPIGEPAVRMVDEQVQLTIGRERTQVGLTFTFANDGPARDVLMGFPVKEAEQGGGDVTLHEFKTWVDGTPGAVTEAPGAAFKDDALSRYPGWMTWTVPFAAGQTRTVRNSYWGKNMYWSNGDVRAGYVLKTGATWAGPIGHALVTAAFEDLLPCDLDRIEPAAYHWEGSRLAWEWREFEPTRDIAIFWNNRGDGAVTPANGAEWNAVLQITGAHTSDDARTAWQAFRRDHPAGPGTSRAAEVALARRLWLAGEQARAEALALVAEAIAAGDRSAAAAYLAVAGGLKPAADILTWDMGPVMKRWLEDQAGVAGEAPAMPVIAFSAAQPPYIPTLDLTLHDPDGDIDDWGLKLWLMQDVSATPVLSVGNDGNYRADKTTPVTLNYSLPGWLTAGEVWVQAWVADGRGHRQETGWVKLTVPEGLKPPDARGAGPGTGLSLTIREPDLPPAAGLPGPTGQPTGGSQRLPWPLALGVLLLVVGGWVASRVLPPNRRGA